MEGKEGERRRSAQASERKETAMLIKNEQTTFKPFVFSLGTHLNNYLLGAGSGTGGGSGLGGGEEKGKDKQCTGIKKEGNGESKGICVVIVVPTP